MVTLNNWLFYEGCHRDMKLYLTSCWPPPHTEHQVYIKSQIQSVRVKSSQDIENSCFILPVSLPWAEEKRTGKRPGGRGGPGSWLALEMELCRTRELTVFSRPGPSSRRSASDGSQGGDRVWDTGTWKGDGARVSVGPGVLGILLSTTEHLPTRCYEEGPWAMSVQSVSGRRCFWKISPVLLLIPHQGDFVGGKQNGIKFRW